ncbi:MAG: PAS domain S-box protein, partial [Promethearchaeota archaeon]
EMTITFMRNENGNAIGILGVSRDISNRKKIEKALKESETKYRHLYEESPNSITLVNRKGTILDVNPATEKIYGYNRDEVIGKKYRELGIYTNEQISLFKKRYKDVLEGKKLKPIEIQIKKKDGSLAWINYQSSIIKKDDNIFVIAIAQDITQRKNAYEALKAIKEFTDNVLNTSIDTIFVFEPQTGRAIKWNKAFSDITGYTDDEIASLKAPDSYYSEEDLKCAAKAIEKVLSEEKTTVEMSLITKDGRSIPFEYTARTFKSVDGDLLIVSVGRDVTKRKKIEMDLRESEDKYRKAYDRANFYKELIAHDMNNLLQTIQSSVELYAMFQNKPEYLKDRRNLLNLITKQVFRGASIVSNIIKLSELEETEISTEPIEVISILEDAIKFVYKSFQGRKVKIEVDTQSKKYFVKANDLILDLFENILINGVKHNINPEIEILVKISEEQKNNINYLKFEFIDNGIGIPDERKDILFQRVTKRNGKVRGLGIGLSLVKQLIDIYNGKIWIENKVKGDYTKGSNFSVLIPKAI